MKTVHVYYRRNLKARCWYLFTSVEANTCKEAFELPFIKDEMKRRGNQWRASFVFFPDIQHAKCGVSARIY